MLPDGKRKIKPINRPLDAKRGVRPEGPTIEMYGERYIDVQVPRSRSVDPIVMRMCYMNVFYLTTDVLRKIHVIKIKNLSSCNTVLKTVMTFCTSLRSCFYG